MPVRSIDPSVAAGQHYDAVVVGSGFGSGFFLARALEKRRMKVLVVEWGDYLTPEQKLERRRYSDIVDKETYTSSNEKPWRFTIGYGGGTNCWYGQAPRMHPSDFRLKSLYGVGADWPITYDDLEPYYVEAEAIMSISGDPDMVKMFPRSKPFPQPPHRLSAVDSIMKAAQPDQHFIVPTARARVANDQRNACCATARCHLCPVNAKFNADNGLDHVFGHRDVSLAFNSRAVRFKSAGNSVRSLEFEHAGRRHEVTADLFVLGANAIHSPAILARSDMAGGVTGKGLVESYGAEVEVFLDGLDNFDGSTITTSINFGLYDGPHRAKYGAAMVEFENRPKHGLRREPGRWRQCAPLIVVVEDLVDPENSVGVAGDDPKAVVNFKGESAYAKLGMKAALEQLPALLAPLPVEKIEVREMRATERHLQATLRMGRDPATSVVDDRLVHHRYRNLVAVGTAVMPTCSAANPSLTAAALALRSAELIV
jgi:choline dehydrogenase-like flavoprotein